MRNKIGRRILAVILAPSLLIFGLLLAFIAYAASQFAVVWAELELKSISEINAADLSGRVRSVQISVLSAANALDTLGADHADGRGQADNIVRAMLENPHMHNVWLAYEPNAFDGRDAEFTSDYPGAPSGRFIRSYVLKDGKIVTAPDMDENTLDDPDESGWYVIPRDTDSLYIDAYNDLPSMYDYGLGDGLICTMAFAAPIHRDGKVIGCVGADMSFDLASLSAGRDDYASVAVFYPNGSVFFTPKPDLAEHSVDALGFTQAERIMEAFSQRSPLFLPDQYSMFLGARAFTYFQPVAVSDRDALFMYTAIPRNAVLSGLRPLFTLISGIIAAALVFMLVIILHVKRKISNPLKSLILAADAVSHGDLETEIPSFPGSRDEIGALSLSLHRMVEQFRVYILRLEQTQKEAVIYSRLDELMASADVSQVMDGVLAMLCIQLELDKAIAVRLSDGSARVFSRHQQEQDGADAEHAQDFLHHARITPLLAGKKLLLMNTYFIAEQGADFLDEGTRFACILPLRDGMRTLGYVILESKGEKNPFGMKTEAVLCGVAQTLSDFLKSNESKPGISRHTGSEEPEKTKASDPDKLYDVDGLDCTAAIRAMGGMTDLYEQALKLMTSLLPETVDRLDSLISSDINDFAIEIHGLKGSLNNVGAYGMGAEALRVEQAAKNGDISLCLELYASFREGLMEFYRRLIEAFERECGRMPGNIVELAELVPKAEEAVRARGCGAALELLRPMAGFSFDLESDALLGKALSELKGLRTEAALESIGELRERLSNWEEG